MLPNLLDIELPSNLLPNLLDIELPSIIKTQIKVIETSSIFTTISTALYSIPRWGWVCGGLLGACVCFKVHYDVTYGVWKRQGVDGPKPVPFFGNMLDMVSFKDFYEMNVVFQKKYGAKGYYGMFTGSLPTLVIADPALISEVFIKKFDVFPNRLQLDTFDPKYFRKNVAGLRDNEWKKVRNILSPTFTGMKIKKMAPFINEIGTHLCAKFDRVLANRDDHEFELKPTFRACTMDIICNIVFGISADSEAEDNEIARACINQTVKNEQLFKNPFRILLFVIPGLTRIWRLFDPTMGFNMEAGDVTAKVMLEILKKKREGNSDAADRTFFLHTLVDKFELHERTGGKEGLDFETTVAQALIFLLAGFDTTANLMMWTSYYLAMYPHLQEEVYEEICSLAGPNGENANYENVNKMQLLENILMETLRVRSVFRTQRQAAADTTIGPGIKIKKGWSVEVAVNVVHMDPKIWGDPEVFRPSRFLPEEAKHRSPYAFNAFGIGPRNCIGMRLALFEVKMAFVKILAKYKLSMGKETPTEITEFMKSGFYDPVKPLFLKVSKRE